MEVDKIFMASIRPRVVALFKAQGKFCLEDAMGSEE